MRLSIVIALSLALVPTGIAGAQSSSRSLDVQEAVRLGLANNVSIRQSEASLGSAEAARMNATARLLPNASGTYSWSKSVSDRTVFDLPARTDQEGNVLEVADFELKSDQRTNSLSLNVNESFGLSDFYSFRGAGAGVTAARHGLEASRQQLAYNVRGQFYLALRAEALLEVQTEDLDLAQQQLRRTQTMFELGSVARADVLKAQVRVSEAEVTLIRQRNAVNIELSRLATLIGYPPSTRFDLVGDLGGAPAPLDSSLAVTQALERPDLLQSRADVQSYRHGHKAAVLSRVPSLFASYSTSGLTGSAVSDQLDQSFVPGENEFTLVTRREEGDIDVSNWQVRVGATVSLDAFLNFGADKAAKANLRRAEYELENRRLIAQQEVEEAILNVRASESAIAAAETGVAAADEDLRLSRERYEQGLGTILELLEAQVNLTRARYTRVNALTELKISEAALERARGVPVGS